MENMIKVVVFEYYNTTFIPPLMRDQNIKSIYIEEKKQYLKNVNTNTCSVHKLKIPGSVQQGVINTNKIVPFGMFNIGKHPSHNVTKIGNSYEVHCNNLDPRDHDNRSYNVTNLQNYNN